jgi:ribosomal protein L37AE/L43A
MNQGNESLSNHQCEITGTRKFDNSLIWKCVKCKRAGLGLLGPCAPPSGPRGRRAKLKQCN